MSDTLVVDASVALKLVLHEDFSPNADSLYHDATRVGQVLVGPPLLPGEVANAIFQQVRRRELTAEVADVALTRFANLGIAVMSVHDLHLRAYVFAREQGLPNVYDSQYVVLARLLGTELWTDDRVLLRSLGNAAPWVRWIADYPVNGA